MSPTASRSDPVPVYEFRVAGEIGPVIRSALPELTFSAFEQSCTLTGVVDGPAELARLLDRIAELHLEETEIRIHRIGGSPAGTPSTASRSSDTRGHRHGAVAALF